MSSTRRQDRFILSVASPLQSLVLVNYVFDRVIVIFCLLPSSVVEFVDYGLLKWSIFEIVSWLLALARIALLKMKQLLRYN